ncbi:endochitinase [Biomphalaria pfeifferi]|uniref:Endochitinase n=1 Tax=Biomphalaria pfeifferi TaxID=112525 RepID=A0AAD8BS36_BIOPF|nr:endochitinase [Biomphalaria pfeifferi]
MSVLFFSPPRYEKRLPNGIYPDPGSCSHFVECLFGNTYHLACPDGLEFDSKAKFCGEANRINCADNYHFSFTAHTG